MDVNFWQLAEQLSHTKDRVLCGSGDVDSSLQLEGVQELAFTNLLINKVNQSNEDVLRLKNV